MSVESLAQALLEGGILDATTVEAGAERARDSRRFIEELVASGEVGETDLLNRLARALSVPRYDPRDRQPEPDALLLLDLHECEELGVLPVASRGAGALLWVAACDPTDEHLLLEVARRTGRRVKACLIGPRELGRALQQARARPRVSAAGAPAEGMPTPVPAPGAAAGHRATMPPLAPVYPPRAPLFSGDPPMSAVAPTARPAASPPVPSSAPALVTPSSTPAARSRELERIEEELAYAKQAMKVLAQLLVERGLLDGEELKRRLRAERERKG